MNDKEIEKIVDGLIVELPIGKNFNLSRELSIYFKSIESDIILNNDILHKVIDFMIENEYIKDLPSSVTDSLCEKGIEVKKAGGHFKYIESLNKITDREVKKDKILDLDIALKEFNSKIGRKLMYFTIFISFLSFLITVLTLEFWKTDESKNEQNNQVETPLLNKKAEVQKDSLN